MRKMSEKSHCSSSNGCRICCCKMSEGLRGAAFLGDSVASLSLLHPPQLQPPASPPSVPAPSRAPEPAPSGGAARRTQIHWIRRRPPLPAMEGARSRGRPSTWPPPPGRADQGAQRHSVAQARGGDLTVGYDSGQVERERPNSLLGGARWHDDATGSGVDPVRGCLKSLTCADPVAASLPSPASSSPRMVLNRAASQDWQRPPYSLQRPGFSNGALTCEWSRPR
jgi:hypothetical protein